MRLLLAVAQEDGLLSEDAGRLTREIAARIPPRRTLERVREPCW
ncbi:DUF6417 family protein [Streptomyces phaeochromogenes]